MTRSRLPTLLLACVFGSAALAAQNESGAAAVDWGVNLADQDRSVNPGDDFAMFQNGGWFKQTDLSPSQPNAAYWRDVRIQAGKRVDAMLTELDSATDAGRTRVERLLSAFHRSGKDVAAIDRVGLASLRPELESLRAASNRAQLARLMGAIEGPGTLRQVSVRLTPGRDFYLLQIAQDQQDPARSALYISQGGLILPGPEYYTDPQFADIKTAYRQYVADMLGLIGWRQPRERAAQIVGLETKIAQVSSSHEQQRDVGNSYHRVTRAQLARLAPDFDWRAFLGGAGVPQNSLMIIDDPRVIGRIANVYATAPLDVLKAKQAFGAAHVNAARLDSKIYGRYRQFSTTALAGIQAGPNRDLDVINLIESAVPDAVSAAYVQRYSSPEVKAKATQMSELIKAALVKRVSASAWLSAEGKAKALEKLDGLRLLVGYPEHFDSYRGLVVKTGDFYGNVSRAAAYDWRKQLGKLAQKFDRSEWALTPFYPQYFYSPVRNVVEVPAALLVPPFFNIHADDAVNYGADGSLIGSQIAGSLVGVGVNYDASGRLGSWLPPADAAQIDRMRHMVSARYSREEPVPGMHIKGELVADEAVQDLAGLEIALDAYHASLQGRQPPVIEGYIGDQRFFLGRAQMWRAKFSVPFLRNQVATGTNAPPYLRINGPIAYIDGWYSAFDIRPGQRLFIPPDQRVHIFEGAD